MKKQAIIKISGLVQGVFFRAGASEKAKWLGLTGWAKNEPDGTVMIKIQGEGSDIKKMVDWCQSGPAFAKVSKVDVKWEKADDELKEFTIKD